MRKHFRQFWTKLYPNAHPISHLLKCDLKDNWVRFHSLPESKRYADTEEETNIILDRQNTLATEVLGKDAACWMVIYDYLDIARTIKSEKNDCRPSVHQATKSRIRSVVRRFNLKNALNFYNYANENRYWVYVGRSNWVYKKFDKYLKLIANDELNIFWISESTGNIFAPYDGGVDLILNQQEKIPALRTKFASWLSTHPSGY